MILVLKRASANKICADASWGILGPRMRRKYLFVDKPHCPNIRQIGKFPMITLSHYVVTRPQNKVNFLPNESEYSVSVHYVIDLEFLLGDNC